MPDKLIKRRAQDAGDAKLVEVLEHSIFEDSQNTERKKEALQLGRDLLRAGRNKKKAEMTRYGYVLKGASSIRRSLRSGGRARGADRSQVVTESCSDCLW